MKKKILLQFLLIMFISLGYQSVSYGQCGDATANTYVGCRPAPITITLPGGLPSYTFSRWEWGDGQVLEPSTNNSETHSFDTFGTNIKPVIILFSVVGVDTTVVCTVQVDKPIQVFDNPKADFLTPPQDTQCYFNNKFCFIDASKKSSSGAPIKNWTWTFGDGNLSKQTNPCHNYQSSGTFTIELQINDTNGCRDIKVKTSNITVLDKLDPNFVTDYPDHLNCPCTDVKFTNNTPNLSAIDSFWWDFGDGIQYDSSQDFTNMWTDFTVKFCKDGEFNPKLVVKGKRNPPGQECKASFTSFGGSGDINYKFQVTANPDSIVCFSDKQISFKHPPRKRSYRQIWMFGDPASGPLNVAVGSDLWSTSHDYTGSGPITGITLQGTVYDVFLRIYEPGCIRDTTYKQFVKIQGPAAIINTLPPPPLSPIPANNRVDEEDQPITRKYFEAFNRYACNPISAVDPITGEPLDTVWYYDKLVKTNTAEFQRDLYDCDTNVTGTFEFIDTLAPGPLKYWIPGTPIPIGKNQTAYLPGGGTTNPMSIHDTDLFDPDCSAPNWVKFTNNSIKLHFTQKFRFNRNNPFIGGDTLDTVVIDMGTGILDTVYAVPYDLRVAAEDSIVLFGPNQYLWKPTLYGQYMVSKQGTIVRDMEGTPIFPAPAHAPDDVPPGQNPAYYFGVWDSCSNPSLPWGSDSLLYLWDFSSDPLSVNCTTFTVAGSRMYDSANCQFSTARVPWHRFDSTGCWQVILKAMDPVTGCESQNTATILMMEPDAGWDKDFFYDSLTVSLPFYGGADSFLMDSLLLTKDPTKPLYAKVLEDGRVLVNGKRVVDTTWYVTNNKVARFHWKPGSTPTFGASVLVKLRAKRPIIIKDIQDTLAFDYMTYELQTILPKFKEQLNQQTGKWETIYPRRGLIISGTPCIGQNYAQRIILDETLPKAFRNGQCPTTGQDYGFIPDSAAALTGVYDCWDSIFVDGKFDHKEPKKYYSYAWDPKGLIESPFYYPPTPPSQYYYTTPGCKTVGLWIRNSSGCIDTFWYHNYKYIADLRPDFSLLDYRNGYQTALTDPQLKTDFCLPNEGRDPLRFEGISKIKVEVPLNIYIDNYSGADSFVIDSLLMDKNARIPYTKIQETSGSAAINFKDIPRLDGNDSNWYIVNKDIAYFHWGKGKTPAKGDTITLNLIAERPQDNIVEFRFEASRSFPGNVYYEDSLAETYKYDNAVDSAWQLCDTFEITPNGDTIFQDCIVYPLVGCDNSILKQVDDKKIKLKWNYTRKAYALLTMRDTADSIVIAKPGVYSFATIIRNANECQGTTAKDVFIGHYAHFDADIPYKNNDTVLCAGDTVYYWNRYGPDPFAGLIPEPQYQFFPRYFTNEFDLVNFVQFYANKIDYFRDPKGIRANRTGPGQCTDCPNEIDGFVQYEHIEYDLNDDGYFETRYNINPGDPAYLMYEADWDKNGTFETILQPRDVNGDGIKDTVPYFVYNKAGVYDISMRSVDSTGCSQITRNKDYIFVTSLAAYMDTFNAPNVCAPSTVHFKAEDTSKVDTGGYKFIYSINDPNKIIDTIQVDSIIFWKWSVYKIRENKDDSLITNYYIENPNHVFLENGQYRVELFVRNTVGCVDSTNDTSYVGDPAKQMNVDIEGPKPEFSILDPDSCLPYKLPVKELSGFGRLWTYRWSKADGSDPNSTVFPRSQYPSDSIFKLNFSKAGVYYLTLSVGDSVYNPITGDSTYCEANYPPTDINGNFINPGDSAKIKVTIYPPSKVKFAIDDATICPGDLVTFTDQSDSIYNRYYWDFGDGTTDSTEAKIIAHQYELDGDSMRYTVTLTPKDTNGVPGVDGYCPQSNSDEVLIVGVTAGIDTLDKSQEPVYYFDNQSSNAVDYEWVFFDSQLDSTKPDPFNQTRVRRRFTTQDSSLEVSEDYKNQQGKYDVYLIATNNIGCTDTAFITVENNFDTTFRFTNVFTPNGDNLNDYFMLELKGAVDFDLTIFNRWGEKVYETNSTEYTPNCVERDWRSKGDDADGPEKICKFWNGTNMNDGSECAPGTYFYIFNYTHRSGTEQTATGTVTLLR